MADLPWLKEDACAAVPAKREYEPGGNDIARENLEAANRLQARRSASTGEQAEGESEVEEGE